MSLQMRQLHDAESGTYTYLLFDGKSSEALLIDPVLEKVERDLGLLKDLNLKLKWILETHIHADHITGASILKERTGAQVALGRATGVTCADRLLNDGEEIGVGPFKVKAISTPGHTAGCFCYAVEGMLFTGDTLFIRSTGRTDFQGGSARSLFENVQNKLFTYPDHTKVFPAHNYDGLPYTTIGEEKRLNPRVGAGMTAEKYEALMASIDKPPPRRMKEAVPANMKCGKAG